MVKVKKSVDVLRPEKKQRNLVKLCLEQDAPAENEVMIKKENTIQTGTGSGMQCCGSGSAWAPVLQDQHHFRKLDPDPHPDPHKSQKLELYSVHIRMTSRIRIQIRIKVKSRTQIHIRIK
jgi:hypothetical protein